MKLFILIVCFLLSWFGHAARAADTNPDLEGLWESEVHFGPQVEGSLIVTGQSNDLYADIMGMRTDAAVENGTVTVRLPFERGEFKGEFGPGRREIRGHWIQPATRGLGQRFASPVVLRQARRDLWAGTVSPLRDTLTYQLRVRRQDDGSLTGFLRNPQRNLGLFLQVSRLELSGNEVSLIGRTRGSSDDMTFVTGRYDAETDRIVFGPQWLGVALDFARAMDDPMQSFFPRGNPSETYRYSVPVQLADGWPVSSLEREGLSEGDIAAFVQHLIDMRAESVHASDIHALLIARHGKLVLEEYFHGFHRDAPHDTRSASKSLTTVLLGAAMHRGLPVGLDTPVYTAMHGDELPAGLDPRKQAMTVGHLATMASGLACDDWDGSSPGGEERMQSQTDQPDWYQFILDLSMIHDPGTHPAYCSGGMNLVGGVLQNVTKRSLADLFGDLIARPLGMELYHLNLMPTGTPYMGGGIYWRPRDFLKLGQVVLGEGVWKGKRLLARAYARSLIEPLYPLGSEAQYALGWWVRTYPYQDGEVTAFFAGGNGGQILMGVPELDLLLLFYGGNYGDPVLFVPQRKFVPERILPAVRQ